MKPMGNTRDILPARIRQIANRPKRTTQKNNQQEPSYEEYKQFVKYISNCSRSKTDPCDELWDYLMFGGYSSSDSEDDENLEYYGGAEDERIAAVKGKRCPKGTRRKGKWCVPTQAVAKKTALVLPTQEETKKDENKKPAKTAMNQFLDEKESL